MLEFCLKTDVKSKLVRTFVFSLMKCSLFSSQSQLFLGGKSAKPMHSLLNPEVLISYFKGYLLSVFGNSYRNVLEKDNCAIY